MRIAVCVKQVVTREWQVRVDEAKTWAASEMAHWKQVTEEVKIDIPE